VPHADLSPTNIDVPAPAAAVPAGPSSSVCLGLLCMGAVASGGAMARRAAAGSRNQAGASRRQMRAEPVSAAVAAAAAAKAVTAAKAAAQTWTASALPLQQAAWPMVARTASPARAARRRASTLQPKWEPWRPWVTSTWPAFARKGNENGFRSLRAAEIKNGRVAMMAALGGVVQHFVKFPGFDAVPSGLSAVTTAPGTYGFAALFLVAGALELALWTEDPSKEPGNFGDPAGLARPVQHRDEAA